MARPRPKVRLCGAGLMRRKHPIGLQSKRLGSIETLSSHSVLLMSRITTPSDFGNALRQRRKALGLTQEELALGMGASRRLLSAMENGSRASSLAMALAAAAELGLAVDLELRSASGPAEARPEPGQEPAPEDPEPRS